MKTTVFRGLLKSKVAGGGYYESNVDKCDDRNLNAVDDLNNVDVLYFDK